MEKEEDKKLTGTITYDCGSGEPLDIEFPFSLTSDELKPFRVIIKPKKEFIKTLIVGFDEIPKESAVDSIHTTYQSVKNEYLKVLKREYLEGLRREHPEINEDELINRVFLQSDEEYIPNWISIRTGTTNAVELKLDWKPDNYLFNCSAEKRSKDYDNIYFEAHDDFEISPINLKDENGNLVDSVTVRCLNNNDTSATLKIITQDEDCNDKIVGAINVFYREPRTVNVEWCFVEVDNQDNESLRLKINQNDLLQYLQKGFKPALIDVNIINQTALTVDLTSQKQSMLNSRILKSNSDERIGDYIVRNQKENFVDEISTRHDRSQNNSLNQLTIYFINLKCIEPNSIKKDGPFSIVGGFSPTGDGLAYIVLDIENKILEESIIHESMHGLGLEHTFKKENESADDFEYLFDKTETKNYMDYFNTRKGTYQWQWEKLQEYF